MKKAIIIIIVFLSLVGYFKRDVQDYISNANCIIALSTDSKLSEIK